MVDSYETLMRLGYVKHVIVFFNVLLFVVTFGLLLTLLIHKLHVERRSRRLEQLKEQYLVDLTKKFYDPDLVVQRPSTPLEFEALGAVFATMLVNVSGDLAENVRRSIRELLVVDHYRDLAGSRSWSKRFMAVEKLGYFRFPELRSLFSRLLEEERDSRVVPKVVWALSLVAERDDLPAINRMLRNPLFMSAKFNEYIYANIIRTFREHERDGELLAALKQIIDDPELPIMLKRDIVQACGSEPFNGVQDLVMDCFSRFNEVAEMRIACIRTLERLSALDAEWLLEKCLEDDDWRIRGVAAKNAYLYSSQIIDPLRKLLYDANYHVRINSALSLARMGEAGVEALVAETRSDDRFVRDVSQYALKRLIYAS